MERMNDYGNVAGQESHCLSLVMPAYNEEPTLERIVTKVLKVPQLLELIIVDDASSDRTSEIAARLASVDARITVISHSKNLGKTQALKTGVARTRGQIVMVQDADLEYDPADILDLITPILEGNADVVFGSRFSVKKAARVLYFTHYLGNKLLTFLSNCLTNLNMSDMETGYKAFRGNIIREMNITSNGFGFEVEVTAKVAKLGCAVYEVPISYYGRTYEEGKKIGAKDCIAALFYIVKYNCFISLNRSFRTVPPFYPGERAGAIQPVGDIENTPAFAQFAVKPDN